jgi:CYTH domain-containing protein
MPTENERKYALRLECESEIIKLAKKKQQMFQGYLIVGKGVSLRIRRGGKVCTMTFKQKVGNSHKQKCNGRVVEIEQKISKRDFDDLWASALNKLEKFRYYIPHDGLIWEIDFFKDHNGLTYFAQAEVELDEDVLEPDVIPDFIIKHLLYAVPLDDDRFSSKRLADPQHANGLLKSLLHEASTPA